MSICSEHNKINCGCQQALTTAPPCPTPEDCPDAQPCSQVHDTDCIIYTGDPITCGNVIVVDTDDNVSTSLSNIVEYVCDLQQNNIPPTAKVYRAYIAQTDTNEPVVSVMQTNLSGTLVWTRTGVGEYSGTLAGEFTDGPQKILLFAQNQNFTKSVLLFIDDANTVKLVTSDSTDNNVAASIEIIIYP